MSFTRRTGGQVRAVATTISTFELPAWATGNGMRIVLLVLLIVCSVLYIIKTSSAAVSGYQIHQLEKQVSALTAEEQQLSSEVAEYSSLTSIEKRLAEVEMTQGTKAKHLIAPQGSVVAKN
jgi:hypothetical protein